MSRGSTGLVGQNTSCKAHKVCISLWPTGWDDVFCSQAHRLVHTRTHDRTRVHIKSIVQYRRTLPPSSVGFDRTETSVQY